MRCGGLRLRSFSMEKRVHREDEIKRFYLFFFFFYAVPSDIRNYIFFHGPGELILITGRPSVGIKE